MESQDKSHTKTNDKLIKLLKSLFLLFFLATAVTGIIGWWKKLGTNTINNNSSIFGFLHNYMGDSVPYLLFCLAISILCLFFIPSATDLMTNSAAGLTEQYWGPKWRTVVINSTTNIPEMVLMLISLFLFGKLGGIATPLGSNFANIYLMFLIAPFIVIVKRLWLRQSQPQSLSPLLMLLWKEKKLVAWHFVISLVLMTFAGITYFFLKGNFPLPDLFDPFLGQINGWTNLLMGTLENVPKSSRLLIGAGLCLSGSIVFAVFQVGLIKSRPELFDAIDDEDFERSWLNFFIGCFGVILCCFILNDLFVAFSELYTGSLENLFGKAIFAGLHFFVGSLISSLPEITVAIENYEEVKSPDLNTALASASVSNAANLVIAGIGCLLALAILPFLSP